MDAKEVNGDQVAEWIDEEGEKERSGSLDEELSEVK